MSRPAFSRYGQTLRYAAPYWRGWALLTLVTLVNIPFALLLPWPMKILVDNVFARAPLPEPLPKLFHGLLDPGSPVALLGLVVAASLAFFAITSLLDLLLTFGWVKVGQRMVHDLSHQLYAQIQERSAAFHTRASVGDLMNRIVYDSWCANAIADMLLLKPLQVVVALASMIFVMVRLDPGLTLVALGVLPFMALSSSFFGRPVRSAARTSLEIIARMQAHVQQTLSGIPVVQAFVQEDRQRLRFLEFASAAVRAEQRSILTGNIYKFASDFVLILGTAVILWIGARHALAGELSVGGLLVFLAYLGSLQGQMRTITEIYRTLQFTGASLDRVMEVLEAPAETPEKPNASVLPPVKGHVRIEDVTFGYEPDRPSLSGVSIEALPGEMIAVVGPTGAGKSTLASLIPRFIDPLSGRVLIDGHDIRDVQLHSLRSQVAMVFQEPFLSPGTIAENIAYGRPGATPAEIGAAARAANAHDFITKLPEGYQALVGERGATFSGGERQRLSIARALLKDAPILILDEPTSALDAQTEWLLLEALKRLMEGRTTLIIAHRLTTIRNAHRIVVMERGRVIETGNHEELLALGGVYRRLYEMQFAPSAA
ncbi:MAG TPA: ABC transporter ATP-binding protein [Chthoniobacteraceae bacterium]|jgi:ATP-binding cassette subfamily B protein/subfamily B ATP-binding cassette protein MsbA